MIPALRKTQASVFHLIGSVVVDGPPPGVWGDLTGVRGDLTNVTGDLSSVRGNLTSVTGNLSGVMGNIDDCNITPEDRKNGVKIEDLILEEKP